MAPKRSVVRVPMKEPPVKKARVMDPISKKIAVVCDALSDLHAEVPCREMLKIAAPMVLQLTSDTRHAYETNVARMIEEVLKTQVAKFANRFSETTTVVDQTQAAKDDVETELANIQKQLEAKAVDVSSCRDQHKIDSSSKDEAEQALKAAEKLVADFQEETRLKTQEFEDCSSAGEILKLDLTLLPASNRNAHVLKVSTQLKGADADMSLQSATPLALQKRPEERGTFDIMAIEQVQRLLEDYKVVLEERLQGRTEIKGEKVAVVDSARSTMQAAVEKCQESAGKLKVAEEASLALQAEQKAKEKALAVQVKELNKVLKQQTLDKKEMDKVNDIHSAFNFLLERDSTTQPLEEADVPASMEAPVASFRYVSVGAH